MNYNIIALVLADHIYQDINSNKFILSGVFHQFNVTSLPFRLVKTFGIFVSIAGLKGDVTITIKIVDPSQTAPLLSSGPIQIENTEVDIPVSFALEVPPFEILSLGKHNIILEIKGSPVHTSPFVVRKI